MTTLTPEQLERFRQIGLSLDRNGEFWHDGGRVEHPRLKRALQSWLDVLADGRTVVRLDETRFAYVEVEDAHLLVRSLVWESDRAWLVLSDGNGEELAYQTLRFAADHAAYARVRLGRLEARFTTAAQHALTTRIEADSADGDRFVLRAAGESFVLPAAGAQPG